VLTGFVLTVKFYEDGDKRTLRDGAIKRYPRLLIPALAFVIFAFVLVYTGN
jgi:peptidoglycan/LPS O-acetylase OafA/YrhL